MHFSGIPSKSKESKNNYELIDQKPLLSEQEQCEPKPELPGTATRLSNREITILIMLVIMVNTFLVKLIAQYFPNYATLHSGLDFSRLIIAEIAFAFTLGRLMYFILGRFWKNNLRRYLYSFSIAFIGIMLLIWVKEVSIIIIIFAICGFIFRT